MSTGKITGYHVKMHESDIVALSDFNVLRTEDGVKLTIDDYRTLKSFGRHDDGCITDDDYMYIDGSCYSVVPEYADDIPNDHGSWDMQYSHAKCVDCEKLTNNAVTHARVTGSRSARYTIETDTSTHWARATRQNNS